ILISLKHLKRFTESEYQVLFPIFLFLQITLPIRPVSPVVILGLAKASSAP
ncbi:hypothetical protein Dimus_001561, partial [Dionaea muscipula]